MGLKLRRGLGLHQDPGRLNRTSVGLKPEGGGLGGKMVVSPQSNQRGIETDQIHQDLPFTPCLPQSNQRGIETSPRAGLRHEDVAPQSNQRGIETGDGLFGFRLGRDGLNRTSVGLKLTLTGCGSSARTGPQSNQRGIETRYGISRTRQVASPQSNQRGIETGAPGGTTGIACPGLNRTSVGLKPLIAVLSTTWISVPQSNQRGIETH